VGYFTVNRDLRGGSVDWEWLAAQPALEERLHEAPAIRRAHDSADERAQKPGMILKPETSTTA
jgi:hypothetical protein